jgi:hypothetical protein
MTLNRNMHITDGNSFKQIADPKLTFWFNTMLGKETSTSKWMKSVNNADDFRHILQNITSDHTTATPPNLRFLADINDTWTGISKTNSLEDIVNFLLKLNKKYADESLNNEQDDSASHELAQLIQHFLLQAINFGMITGSLKETIQAQFKAENQARAQQNKFAFYFHPPKHKRATERDVTPTKQP